MIGVVIGIFPLDAFSYARHSLLGLAISSCLFLTYIILLIANKFSRLWAWSAFGLLLATVFFITYLQDITYA